MISHKKSGIAAALNFFAIKLFKDMFTGTDDLKLLIFYGCFFLPPPARGKHINEPCLLLAYSD